MLPDPFHQVSAQGNIWVGKSCSLRIPRWLFNAWPSLISEWNERSIYESLFSLKHPIKFLLIRTYSLEEDVV